MRAWTRGSRRAARSWSTRRSSPGSSRGTVILPLGSMFLGVLATAAVADLGSATAQVLIAIIAWVAIVAVNVVYAVRR